MRPASYQHSSYTPHASPRRQAAALALAIIANVLLVIMLLTMAPSLTGIRDAARTLTTVQLIPEPRVGAPRARTATKVKHAGGGASPRSPKPPASPAPAPPSPLQMTIVSKEVFAASDISKLPSHSSDHQPEGEGTGVGKDSGAAEGPGEGPGGERLYNAEWYVKPSHAELAYYMPAGAARSGWGMIACRTIANFRVDDCQEIGDSPAGSGLARAVRQAAWQFRVLPPRIGGRPMVGAWVRIRIDFTETDAK